jgi:hypothetical protein
MHATPTHTPIVQTSDVGQRRPQAPQLFGSVAVSTQAPLQFERPAEQESMHRPSEHTALVAQRTPHIPQFAGLDRVSTQVPLQITSDGRHVGGGPSIDGTSGRTEASTGSR